jgi:branched-chain amino acid aminotransferase
MAFGLNTWPVVYRAKYDVGTQSWKEEYLEKLPMEKAAEDKLGEAERAEIYEKRNFYTDMPLVGYTSQYGFGVFEGIKAMPQKKGGLAVFRPDQNGGRFERSMKGLYMPAFPEKMLVNAVVETVRRNAAMGYTLQYDQAWEKDNFASAPAIYIRPFSYSEGAIGVGIAQSPWVVIVCSPVTSYYGSGSSDAIVSDRVRATPNGTGWIKCDSNYVISALAKHEANDAGYVECIFLDAATHSYFEECSSCNVFFYMKNGELATPELGDTILPGITRKSIIEIAKDMGIKVSERKVSVDEVLSDAKECFFCGTAAGATPFTSLTYKGKKTEFNGGKVGELSLEIQRVLKGIQYGLIEDKKGWLHFV